MKSLKLASLNLFIFIALAMPSVSIAQSNLDIHFFESTLADLNSGFMDQSQECSALEVSPKNCSHLFSLFERDKSTGLFFGMINDSPWDVCKKYISSDKEISLFDLEKKYAKHARTNLGLRDNYFSSKFTQCFNQKNKIEKTDAETQSKMIVSMGYDYLNRLKKSTHQLMEETVRLNSLLGNPLDQGVPCDSFTMPEDKKFCSDLKAQKCQSHNDLNMYSDSLYENAIEPMIVLKKAHKELADQMIRDRGNRNHRKREALKDLNNKIKSIESQFPLLKGKSLKSFLDRETHGGKNISRDQLQGAVRNQLVENRDNLKNKMNENIDMNNCILYGDESFCKKFNENFKRVPPSEEVMFFEQGLAARSPAQIQNRAATELYSSNQCMDNFRGLKSEFNSFAADFSINVGLTVFTGGAGLLLRAGGQGVKMGIASHKAMLVADAAFLGVGVDEAIATCSEELNKLETIANDKRIEKNNRCPSSLASPENVVVANYQGCITGAMLASLNALPFVPTVATKYLARSKSASANPSEITSLMKFSAPKKSFDAHDLRSAGVVFEAGKKQDPSKVFQRDGVYVYIVDDKGNMVISHRTPNLEAGTSEGDQFLGTHRGLFNKLREKGESSVVAAGEIRVVGGSPITVSPRAGSFHNTPEELLENMKRSSSQEERKYIDGLLEKYKSIDPEDRSNAMMVEMHIEDYLDINPAAREVFEKAQSQLSELTSRRLDMTKEALESRGLLSSHVETNFTRNVGGDAHIEGKAAAIAEINCMKNAKCAAQIKEYQATAKRFFEKYKGPKQSETAVVAKLAMRDIEGLSQKERAFQFFGERSYLLFKEGPIEFIQNSHPEKYGLTGEEALKYLGEWSKQF